jgi:hypothetical protein
MGGNLYYTKEYRQFIQEFGEVIDRLVSLAGEAMAKWGLAAGVAANEMGDGDA